jgi:hypothetical protein
VLGCRAREPSALLRYVSTSVRHKCLRTNSAVTVRPPMIPNHAAPSRLTPTLSAGTSPLARALYFAHAIDRGHHAPDSPARAGSTPLTPAGEAAQLTPPTTSASTPTTTAMAARDALDTARALLSVDRPRRSARTPPAQPTLAWHSGVVSWVACWTGAVELCESIPRRRGRVSVVLTICVCILCAWRV